MLWHSFLDKPSCCLPAGFARKLQAKALAAQPESRDWYSDSSWCLFWWFYAQVITLQCADVEWRHGRNRARNNQHGFSGWSQFVSRYIIGEAVCSFEARRAEQKATAAVRKRTDRADANCDDVAHRSARQPGMPKPDIIRAPTAFDLFRWERLPKEKALGRRANACSTEVWDETKREFASLPPDQRQRYEAPVQNWKHIAMRNRVAARERLAGDFRRADDAVSGALAWPVHKSRWLSWGGERDEGIRRPPESGRSCVVHLLHHRAFRTNHE